MYLYVFSGILLNLKTEPASKDTTPRKYSMSEDNSIIGGERGYKREKGCTTNSPRSINTI